MVSPLVLFPCQYLPLFSLGVQRQGRKKEESRMAFPVLLQPEFLTLQLFLTHLPYKSFTESQNGKLEGTTVGHLVQHPCSARLSPELTAQDCIQTVLEHLQWERFHSHSGQPAPVHSHQHSKVLPLQPGPRTKGR